MILPPVNLAHTFLVEMPVTYKDVTIESVIRLHEIIQMEKPANTSYYLRFLSESRAKELRGFFEIGVRSGVGIGQEVLVPLPAGGIVEEETEEARTAEMRPADMPQDASVDEFVPPTRGKPPLPKAPKADNAPIEGQEVRTNLAGGFDSGAREMRAITLDEALESDMRTQATRPPTAAMERTPTSAMEKAKDPDADGGDDDGGKGPSKAKKKPTTPKK